MLSSSRVKRKMGQGRTEACYYRARWGKDLTAAPCLIEEVAGHPAGILEKGVRQTIQAVA